MVAGTSLNDFSHNYAASEMDDFNKKRVASRRSKLPTVAPAKEQAKKANHTNINIPNKQPLDETQALIFWEPLYKERELRWRFYRGKDYVLPDIIEEKEEEDKKDKEKTEEDEEKKDAKKKEEEVEEAKEECDKDDVFEEDRIESGYDSHHASQNDLSAAGQAPTAPSSRRGSVVSELNMVPGSMSRRGSYTSECAITVSRCNSRMGSRTSLNVMEEDESGQEYTTGAPGGEEWPQDKKPVNPILGRLAKKNAASNIEELINLSRRNSTSSDISPIFGSRRGSIDNSVTTTSVTLNLSRRNSTSEEAPIAGPKKIETIKLKQAVDDLANEIEAAKVKSPTECPVTILSSGTGAQDDETSMQDNEKKDPSSSDQQSGLDENEKDVFSGDNKLADSEKLLNEKNLLESGEGEGMYRFLMHVGMWLQTSFMYN